MQRQSEHDMHVHDGLGSLQFHKCFHILQLISSQCLGWSEYMLAMVLSISASWHASCRDKLRCGRLHAQNVVPVSLSLHNLQLV